MYRRSIGTPILDVLDVAVLTTLVFTEMFHITDPRGDARLQYLGGAGRLPILSGSWTMVCPACFCHAAGPGRNSALYCRCRRGYAT